MLSLADARTWVDDAVKRGAITFPPFETEDWPGCRALVEWVIRGLPAGGLGYPRTEYSPEDIAAIAARFFSSSYGSPMDDADHRELLDTLLWYGTDYGPGEPLKWSPVRIEILLDDWLPRKIVAPAEYLAKAPNLLRAFIRFAHAEVGIRSELTQEALSAVDHWEPVYQETIRSDRAQGAEAILAAMGVGPPGCGTTPTTPRSRCGGSTGLPARSADPPRSTASTTTLYPMNRFSGRVFPTTLWIASRKSWTSPTVAATSYWTSSAAQRPDACWVASPPPDRRCFAARDDRKPQQRPSFG